MRAALLVTAVFNFLLVSSLAEASEKTCSTLIEFEMKRAGIDAKNAKPIETDIVKANKELSDANNKFDRKLLFFDARRRCEPELTVKSCMKDFDNEAAKYKPMSKEEIIEWCQKKVTWNKDDCSVKDPDPRKGESSLGRELIHLIQNLKDLGFIVMEKNSVRAGNSRSTASVSVIFDRFFEQRGIERVVTYRNPGQKKPQLDLVFNKGGAVIGFQTTLNDQVHTEEVWDTGKECLIGKNETEGITQAFCNDLPSVKSVIEDENANKEAVSRYFASHNVQLSADFTGFLEAVNKCTTYYQFIPKDNKEHKRRNKNSAPEQAASQ